MKKLEIGSDESKMNEKDKCDQEKTMNYAKKLASLYKRERYTFLLNNAKNSVYEC